MARILEGIAIATGVALGLSAALKSRGVGRSAHSRIEHIEVRLEILEDESLQALADQQWAIGELRDGVDEMDRRLAAQVEAAGNRPAQVRAELTLAIETSLSSRMRNLEWSLRAELDARYQKDAESIGKAIDRKIFDRMANLEETLADRSAAIDALRSGARVLASRTCALLTFAPFAGDEDAEQAVSESKALAA